MGIRGKIFAATYDQQIKGAEKAGLAAMRQALVSQASGEVLEIGGGTGANLAHYGPGVTALTITEPEAPMLKRLQRRVQAEGAARATPAGPTVLRAPAEDLPCEDDTFDVVVSTLVLCGVDDQPRAIREIRRVLRPQGRLLFLERRPVHRSQGGATAGPPQLAEPAGGVLRLQPSYPRHHQTGRLRGDRARGHLTAQSPLLRSARDHGNRHRAVASWPGFRPHWWWRTSRNRYLTRPRPKAWKLHRSPATTGQCAEVTWRRRYARRACRIWRSWWSNLCLIQSSSKRCRSCYRLTA